MTFHGHLLKRNEGIGFREISGDAGSRNFIGNNSKIPDLSKITIITANKIDHALSLDPPLAHIIRIHEDYTSTSIDAAISIVKTVDCGVELIMGSNRHHQKLALFKLDWIHWMNGEVCHS